MLPTKGYFQDIECPYYDSSCGRPYCHFRHRKKPTESVEEIVEPEKDEIPTVPTYKPTPKSELANIHSKSHIPISYVPDLAFRPDRKSRPIPKFDKPTYKPTPLSILSSANKRGGSISEENGEHIEAIKEIKQNIANVEYDPTLSLQSAADIDFEDLSSEFDLIDEIINSGDKIQKNVESIRENSAFEQDKPEVLTKNENVHKAELKSLEKPEVVGQSEIKRQEQADIKNTVTSVDKNGKKSEKPNEKNYKKKERRHEKSSEKGNDKFNREINKEKSSKKSSDNEKLKKIKPEKNSDKTSNSKNKQEKHTNSDKDRSSSSSKEKICKEKSEKHLKDKSHKSSSRDKHRKEEKEDRKEEKHPSHKSKDRSRSRSKERKKSRELEKVKEKRHCDKDRKSKNLTKQIGSNKDKNRETKHEKPRNDKKVVQKKVFVAESSDDSEDNFPMPTDSIEDNLSDLDFDDEDETMLECYKIFNEYRPPEKIVKDIRDVSFEEVSSTMKGDDIESLGRKRVAHANAETSTMYSKLQPPSKPKPINTPGQVLSNRYKIAKLAQANKEQEFIINEIKQPTAAVKRPAPTLLEAARERKFRMVQSQSKISEVGSLVDHIMKGSTKQSIPQQKIVLKKIAPAQNVGLMAKAKERLSKIKQTAQTKTVAQTQKGGRVAHIPEVSLSDIPDVLHADKSKLPVNVRTKFLTMIADECVKLYISKEEAFTRALNEEFSCYEKCKVVTTYRNSAMLAVNRLRKEIQERQKLGLGLINLGEDPSRDSSSEFSGKIFYNRVKKWILTEEELDIHGYPRESEQHHGRAVIKNRKTINSTNLDENQRMCCRCHKVYQVDDDGWPLFEEECLYHPLKKRTIRGEQTYLCCRSNDDIGCASSDTHVSESVDDSELEGFQTTMDPESDNDPRSYSVYALDCEMCYTTKGLELTRVSIVDSDCKTVYESLVKPLNPIIDYNTRFSGITKEQMDKTSTSILQIQANILHLCNSKTILVGHSLESDMKALKIVHGTVIDTSVLFPHKMGLPHKRALKALASEYLRKIIQNDISGHDSAEDAITCMDLIKWKLKDDLKSRGSK